MRVKRYQIVSAADEETLKNEINKLLAEGWQPFSSPVITSGAQDTGRRYFQAMVQYEGEIRL
jgi:hypothetical protein